MSGAASDVFDHQSFFERDFYPANQYVDTLFPNKNALGNKVLYVLHYLIYFFMVIYAFFLGALADLMRVIAPGRLGTLLEKSGRNEYGMTRTARGREPRFVAFIFRKYLWIRLC